MAVSKPRRSDDGRSSSELRSALRACSGAFLGVGLLSGVLNVLALSGSLYMLQVYDRVLPSRSIPTLVALTAIVGAVFLFQGLFDALRMRILGWIGTVVDERLGARVFAASAELPLRAPAAGDAGQAQRDLDQIRSFLSGAGPTALFDAPWIPLYLAICALFHPLIGLVALAGAAILCILTALTEGLTRAPSRAANRASATRNRFSDASRRNAEVLRAMGFAAKIEGRWSKENAALLDAQRRIANVAGGFGALSKAFRLFLQSAVLGLGAWLVIEGQATGGVMIASSIVVARALAPVELAIGSWKSFVAARQSAQRLKALLAALPPKAAVLDLPAPERSLSVESLSLAAPGGQKLLVIDASFRLAAGQAVGVIGPSASGKSCLARALVGVWQPARGSVRLDGAGVDRWSPEALGRHIGYLPQDIELFAGTVADNISRFDGAGEARAIVAAAKAAGVHEMILRLAEGYETEIGEGGTVLSAGQRQRIALARALYRDPFLVVLDEPNSNLDAEGEAALTRAIFGVRARGGIAVLIAHRASALAGVDHVLVLADGRVQAFGEKGDVLDGLAQRQPAIAGPVHRLPALEAAE